MNYGANLQTKESIIEEYLKNVNFSDPKFSVNRIKQELRTMLKEEPGIQLSWQVHKAVNEVTNKETIVEKINTVKVVYTTQNAEGQLVTKSMVYYI